MSALPIAGAPRIDRASYERLAKRARLLSWLSLAWMTVEGAVAIAAGLAASSIALIGGTRPDETWVGIALAASSVVLMPLLGIAKQRIADQIGSDRRRRRQGGPGGVARRGLLRQLTARRRRVRLRRRLLLVVT